MVDCLASAYVDDLTVPAYVVHPASEMDRETSLQQQAMLEAAGVGYSVVENGVHGSSLLVDGRTGHDMSEARAMVLEWLKSATDGAVR